MAKSSPEAASKPTQEKQQDWFSPGKLALYLVIISCLVYANTLENGYVLDDSFMITSNSYVQQGFKGIPALLTTPHLKGYAPDITDTYRPLSLVMFAIEYQFFGLNPVANHFFNILTFAAAVLLLFLFLNKLFDGKRLALAFMATLIFAVHPIHTEAVANIKSRDELLCFVFAFLALNKFIDYSRQGKWQQLALGTAWYILAIISKETATTFIVVVPFIFFFYTNENRRRAIFITCCTFAVAAAFIITRSIIIEKYRADGMLQFTLLDNQLVAAPDMASRLATAILILGNYLKLSFIPYPLICDYSYHSIPLTNFGDIRVLAALAIHLALGIAAVYLLIKNKKDPWAFGIIFYMATLSMFSNLAFIVGATQADRFLFFASAGTCLLMALAIEKWILRSPAIIELKGKKAMVLFAICFVYTIITVARNTDWKDEYTLYKTDVEKSPDNTRLYTFLGSELQKKYEAETDPTQKIKINNECITSLRRALQIYPQNASAHAEIGTAFLIANESDSAILHFKEALELNPKKLNALTNLGTLYSIQAKYAEAIPYYVQTIALEPDDIITWFNLGICYIHTAKYDSAIYSFKNVIAIDPSYNNYLSFANMAAVYKQMGKADSALKYEQVAQQYDPRFRLQ